MTESTDRVFGWGLIGASTIARSWMVKAINSQPNGKVLGVHSSDPGRGHRFAVENGIPHSFARLDDLLADPGIDAVYISTTNEWHKPQTIAAARAGKHVLCEKPLALSLTGAREMVDACSSSGVVFATNHHLRNAVTHRAIRDTVSSGEIGVPLAARVFHAVYLPPALQGWRIDKPASGGGVILDITVHDVDTLRFVLGSNPVEVTAMTASQGMAQSGLEDAVMGVIRFENGVLAQFHDAFTVQHTLTGIEVHGTDGSVFGRDVMTQVPKGDVVVRHGEEERTVDLGEHEDLYVRSVKNFTAAMSGEGDPSASADDGIWSLGTALAVAESAANGRTVSVSLS